MCWKLIARPNFASLRSLAQRQESEVHTQGPPRSGPAEVRRPGLAFRLSSLTAPPEATPARLVVNMAPGRGESEDGPRLELSLLSTKSPLQLWSLKMSMSFMSLVETFYPICFSPFTFSVTQQNVWSEGDPGRA